VTLRRSLAAVTPQDEGTGGRPLLWAYGRRWLLAVSGRSKAALDRAVRAGLDLADPVEAVAWALTQRGRQDLATAIRETLRTSGHGNDALPAVQSIASMSPMLNVTAADLDALHTIHASGAYELDSGTGEAVARVPSPNR
jgi:hypothetical protein